MQSYSSAVEAPPKTLGDRLTETGGRSTGFDYLRILLAASVMLWHSFGTSYGLAYVYKVDTTWVRAVVAIVLPMFFALSGFLVAGSLARSRTVSTFVGLRVLRIAPALTVEVVLSALVLGPLLTTYPAAQYFSDPIFSAYFLNVFGYIHYALPGLFLSNPLPGVVNGQLWTVPWELKCYVSLVALSVLSVVKRNSLFVALIVVGCIALWYLKLGGGFEPANPARPVPGSMLVMSFLSAVATYNYRDSIPWKRSWFLASSILSLGLLSIPGGDYFISFPVTYMTVYLGLLNPAKFGVLRGADYSYGLYLYGYAIQQSVVRLGAWAHHWYLNLAISLAIGTLFAALSWTIIEKPALKLRRHLPSIERFFAAIKAKRARPQPAETAAPAPRSGPHT